MPAAAQTVAPTVTASQDWHGHGWHCEPCVENLELSSIKAYDCSCEDNGAANGGGGVTES